MNNFHSHTYLCKHAEGTVSDYVAQAVKKKCTKIGISDHCPLPDNRWLRHRMSMDELPGYLNDIIEAQMNFPDIEVYSGMETEFSEEYLSFYRDFLLDECSLDYLIGSVHYFRYKGEWQPVYKKEMPKTDLPFYVKALVSAMETGLYAFMAHPDVFATSYLVWDDEAKAACRDIFCAAENYQIPLEINTYGFRKEPVLTEEGIRPRYPLKRFWELASDYNITVVINADAHCPEDVVAGFDQAQEIVTQNKLRLVEPNIKKKNSLYSN